jgi:hypothetical protein
MTVGPNVKRLIAAKTSKEAIPDGGGFAYGIEFLKDKERFLKTVKESHDWVFLAIAAVRQAAEPNPWRNADDEAIAGEILRGIDERRPKWLRRRSP